VVLGQALAYTVALGSLIAALATVIVYFAAPLLLGAAAFNQAINKVAELTNIPAWAKLLAFLALFPPLGIWLLRRTISSKVRRHLAIALVGAALVCSIGVAVTNRKNYIAPLVHKTLERIQRFCFPVREVDPTQTAWFSSGGRPKLFFVRHATNDWVFYRAYRGAYDPLSGLPLEPVTPGTRQQWQSEMDTADKMLAPRVSESRHVQRAHLAAEVEPRTRVQQPQTIQDSLHHREEQRVRNEQILLRGLIEQLQEKQSEIDAQTEQDSVARCAEQARREIDSVLNELTEAGKQSRDGLPLDLPWLQKITERATRKAEDACQKIGDTLASCRAKEAQRASELAAARAALAAERQKLVEPSRDIEAAYAYQRAVLIHNLIKDALPFMMGFAIIFVVGVVFAMAMWYLGRSL